MLDLHLEVYQPPKFEVTEHQPTMYKFAAAMSGEPIVFGASRPGYSRQQIRDWIEFMKCQEIQRICCLLPDEQLTRYPNLLGIYQQEFGKDEVCWGAIADFHLSDTKTLCQKILPFLAESDKQGKKTAVHCSGGIGRTGQVLAAWLVFGRGLSNSEAIAAVRQTGRNSWEAAVAAPLLGKNPLQVLTELDALLNACRP